MPIRLLLGNYGRRANYRDTPPAFRLPQNTGDERNSQHNDVGNRPWVTMLENSTQTVETVEKVPFQKLIFEKWVRNIEKRLVFCVLNNILAIFEPVVGDFYEHFSIQGFFDSLVGRHSSIS